MALILNQRKRTLTSDSYGFTKAIRCPLNKKWDELQVVDELGMYGDEFKAVSEERHRHCHSCQQNVFNLDGLSEEQIEASIMANPTICIHATLPHPAIIEDPASKRLVSDRVFDKPSCPRVEDDYTDHGLREVKTARSLASLNQAVADGMKIQVVALEANADLARSMHLVEHKDGTYAEVVDYRQVIMRSNQVKPMASYGSFAQYRYHFNNPWAAYLIPSDIKVGEQVFVWDVIQDRVGTRQNHGGSLRQGQAIATWTGEVLDIPMLEPEVWIG